MTINTIWKRRVEALPRKYTPCNHVYVTQYRDVMDEEQVQYDELKLCDVAHYNLGRVVAIESKGKFTELCKLCYSNRIELRSLVKFARSL